MQKYVTMNWWEGNDGLEVPVQVVRYGRMYRQAPSTHHGRGILCFVDCWSSYVH